MVQVTNGVWQAEDFYIYSGSSSPPIKGPLLCTVVSPLWGVFYMVQVTNGVWQVEDFYIYSGSSSPIKYTSQRTGCELTTVHSSGPFIGGEEEPEYI
jgi:hypothetical protein